MKKRYFLVTFIAVLLTGCAAQKYSRGVSSNLVSYLYPKGQSVSHGQDQLPVLSLPLRVGIAFVPESKHIYNFTLTEVEKQRLLKGVADKFSRDPAVAHIEIIPEIYLKQGRGFVTVKQVADMYGVDIMALVSYDQVEINETNRSALAYLTIIGAAFIKGESTEFQTFVDTALFDVTTRKLLFRAPGTNSVSREHTAFGFEKDNRQMRVDSFHQASKNMTENLAKELELFRVRAKKGEGVRLEYSNKNPRQSSLIYGGGGSAGLFGVVMLVLLSRFTRNKRVT